MSDDLMPHLHLELSRPDFERLPRHPAYKYELIDGTTYISPRPRYYHARLDLTPIVAITEERPEAQLRPARPEDLDALVPIFAGAFSRAQPFASLPREDGRHAAEQSLSRTFSGEDGPFVEPASFVMLEKEAVVGAILITLLPGGDPTDWDSYHWDETPAADLWARGQGQPHLTWIFVKWFSQGTGVGTRLLAETRRVLQERGYASLWTTFMVGNDSSLLWHWRNGFELLPYPLSKRRRLRDLRLE